MKAAIYNSYGAPEVVEIADLPMPTPKSDEVLVKIEAASLSSADSRMRSLSVPRGFGIFARPAFGFFGPRKRILGSEFSGTIVEIGSTVQRFKVGQKVFGFPGFGLNCHAEYRVMPENGRILIMPELLSFEQAAALSFGGTTALHFLRDLGKVRPGENLLIIGASGSVGSAAVQIGKSLGANVSGVTSSRNLDLVRSLGCDRVFNYQSEEHFASGETYDIVFDTVGAGALLEYKSLLSQGGRLLLAAGDLPQLLAGAWHNLTGQIKVCGGASPERLEDLQVLRALAETTQFVPNIDRCFTLSEMVEAHRYVDSGRKRGNVVIRMLS